MFKSAKFVFLCLLCTPLAVHAAEQKQEKHIRITSIYPLSERTCLERAIFFEANRSSRDGMLSVATVVMNRVNSSAYPDTICGVVGQEKQFAPGVLDRPMKSSKADLARVRSVAEAVLQGERAKDVKDAMFFHQEGLTFPYNNMHYVHVAGGNIFYEKRNPKTGALQLPANNRPYDVRRAFLAQMQGNAPELSETEKTQDLPAPEFLKGLTAEKISEIGAYLLSEEKPNPSKEEEKNSTGFSTPEEPQTTGKD